MSKPENSFPTNVSPPVVGSSRADTKSQRVLACCLCQQRKVKCDRNFPCQNCVKARAQCVPAKLGPSQRRRRFPERELLERLRRYEGLLRRNNINFEPLHSSDVGKLSTKEEGRGSDSPDDTRSEEVVTRADRPPVVETTIKSNSVYEAKNFWHAMNQKESSQDPEEDDNNVNSDDDEHGNGSINDGMAEAVVRKALDQAYQSNDHLLFGARKTNVELSTLHPNQVQIFRLWQIYLENVNPLLSVTHTPTLQARIIDAASDVANISPALEALMFGIYCVSILSLADDECRTVFGSPREELLASYHFACQQALLNCGVLRSGDRECLTALYLYLISIREDTDPRSICSMLAVAIRNAQRMGIHNESGYAKCTALEAEMRRRLWWSLMTFDSRISEMSDLKSTTLVPTWDCRPPLNVNDFDMRAEMKTSPTSNDRPTEALFTVVRSELGNFIRHSAFHLDFTNPVLKIIVKHTHYGSVHGADELSTLEKTMQDKYLKFCNPENPLHFMTLWSTRGYLAKSRLLEHYSRYSRSSVQQTDTERDAAVSYALRMLECDTKLLNSPLTKRYHWFILFNWPFPAYIHLVQDLRKRPLEKFANDTWEVMSDNYEARCMHKKQNDNPLSKMFSRMVLQAWEAREAACKELDEPLGLPRIMADIKRKRMQQTTPSTQGSHDIQQPSDVMSFNFDDFFMPMPMPVNFGGGYPDTSGPAAMDVDFGVNQLDWTTIDSNPMYARGW